METVAQAFAKTAAENPDRPCIQVPARPGRDYAAEGLDWSYGEVREMAATLRQSYAAAGYGHGHRIAILLENRPSFVLHWLALNALGVSVVPINPDYPPDEIRNIVSRSGALLALTLAQRADDLAAAVAGLEPAPPVVASEWLEHQLPSARREPLDSPPGRQSESGLLFTSGTTGWPKGCVLSNEAFFSNGQRYIEAGGIMAVEHGAERLFNPLPLYYANAFAITNVAMILAAGCMIFPDRFHPASFWREIVETDATIMHYLGIIPPLLLRQEPVPEETQQRLKFGGGAGIDPQQHHQWEERFGFPLVEFFGMSEVGICSATNVEPRKVGSRSVGRPLPGIEYRLVDDQDGEVGVDEPGQLLVRRAGPEPGLGLFSGYLDEPETTAEVWRGGWFHTGDVMRRDGDGLYYFVDRLKHMIRRSGQNIPAAEVEEVLRAHPAVEQVACVAAPDELRQEEVLACIIPAPDSLADEAGANSIMDWALERLAYFKAPGWIIFVDTLPTTNTQKLQKNRIFEAHENPLDRPGCIDLRGRKKRQASG